MQALISKSNDLFLKVYSYYFNHKKAYAVRHIKANALIKDEFIKNIIRGNKVKTGDFHYIEQL